MSRHDRIITLQEQMQGDYQKQYYPNTVAFSEELVKYMLDANEPLPTSTPEGYFTYQMLQLLEPVLAWTSEDYRLIEAMHKSTAWSPAHNSSYNFYRYFFSTFLETELKTEGANDNILAQVVSVWQTLGFDEKEVLSGILEHVSWYNWYVYTENQPKRINSAGRYLIQMERKNRASFFAASSAFSSLNIEMKAYLFELFLNNDPTFAQKEQESFLEIQREGSAPAFISTEIVRYMLEFDALKYEKQIVEKIPTIENMECAIEIYDLLALHFSEKYAADALAHALLYIQKSTLELQNGKYEFNRKWSRITKTTNFICLGQIKKLAIANPAKYEADLFAFCANCAHLGVKMEVLEVLTPIYKEKILPAMLANSTGSFHREDYYSLFFKQLATLDYSAYNAEVWTYANINDKKTRTLAAILLAKQGDRAIPNAEKLLNDKKPDNRQTGAFILSLIQTPAAIQLLMQNMNTETDDNTRDLMLETIKDAVPMPQTEAEMQVVIAEAKNRKKLDKPFEKWLIEADLPRLYWLSGAELTDVETRFLFYRQTRSKDIRIDTEAKPMLALLDKTKSAAFANALLKTFIANGADAKAKYCMPLATSLGGDAEIDLLKSKVIEWVDNARGKMAEYAVKAIALNGGRKALRLIEFYSRKYKSKYKNIGAAANEAFDLVAEELGIPPYELADTIIPDFGFEGLFKEFEAGGETYRAFVNNDFKILFLDEDNKIIKTVPKATSAELKDDFKDTAKEIKDIVKSQTSRLEQYLVIQRQWNTEKWQNLFLQNPVMFVYAVRIVWGAYSTDNKLLYTFRCTEDQCLINMEGDEIELDENLKIGLVHPIALDAASIGYWNENLVDSDIVPIFPQLLRPVVHLTEADKTTKMSSTFKGVQYGGYGFLGRMDKTGWHKGSIVDNGMISSYYKDFPTLGISAVIEQTGTHCVGYYEENAEMGDFYFVKSKGIKFGSYYYDDPRDSNDPRLIAFGDVPAIVYSEVMADLTFFKDNDARP
jgi:hypothetical protein